MRDLIKSIIPDAMLFSYRRKKAMKQFVDWEKAGKPIPQPHIVKQLVIEEYQKITGHQILIETGTFMGDMIESQRRSFKTLYSIELFEPLFKRAAEKFKDFNHITIIHGDSAEKIIEIVRKLDQPAIFWLDGHYSGEGTAAGITECPVMAELEAIFTSNIDHCILIDDARLFGVDKDYPTIEEVKKFVQNNNTKYSVELKDDIIRIH